MKKFLKIAAIGVLSISLSGCQILQPALGLLGGNSISTQSPVAVTTAEKYLTITHLAYNAIGNELITAAQPGGVLHGDNAITAKTWYDKAGLALDAADKADDAANADGIMSAVSQAQDAIEQINSIIHPKGN